MSVYTHNDVVTHMMGCEALHTFEYQNKQKVVLSRAVWSFSDRTT